ncbi:MAG: hypothetical protein AAF447_09945 [Myxococcota bacterium]
MSDERDLSGRCGSCGWYIRLRRDERGHALGECRLGRGSSPLKDTATCSSHKPVGQSFEGALKRKRVAGAPRTYAGKDDAPPPRPTIPRELGIDMDQDEFRTVLREVLLDELGVRDVAIGDRWNGGELVLVPGREGTQEKRIPLDVFFKKITMVREKLRVLEQKVNGNKTLSIDERAQLQQYITACYGSLTTFNVLFREKGDQFSGQKGG